MRKLADKERVRMAAHAVVWLPESDDHPSMMTIRRILEMLETMPASRVAAQLTAEGVPSPDAGRTRTDNGVTHTVSGVWHQSTIVNIARNKLLVAIVTTGRRSMGDQLRFSPDGPRALNECDYRHDEKPKVVRNLEAKTINAPASFGPLVPPERHENLIALLDERAGRQKGKPRSRNPALNPLGCRVFDANCRWPMYRTPYNGSFRYVCGLYQQSHSQHCSHNHVDGPAATRFALSVLRQRLFSPAILAKLRNRLRQLAESELGHGSRDKDKELTEKRASLARLSDELTTIGNNMALASSKKQYEFLAEIFERKSAEKERLETDIEKICSRITTPTSIVAEIDAAVAVLDRLPELASDAANLGAIGEAFRIVNLRMFLRFNATQSGKRVLQKLTCGSLTFGNAAAPIALYEGPTARKRIKSVEAAMVVAGPKAKTDDVGGHGSIVSGAEGNSSGNVNRGDRI